MAEVAIPGHRAVSIFELMTSPARLGLMARIGAGRTSVTALIAAMGIKQTTVSHHLALMRGAGVVEAERAGRRVFYSLTELGRVALDAALRIEAAATA